ncbi:uncharacterized protein LOC124144778 [Haliotis rufescens]|uniref:uncharacterized protein LOC124144778 n=1 Tax=Haliotis rufescens TaxID=6454 RepID=UPI001EAFEE7B|nr:uncharacterized protein LOC124144778 [Haliotis rufescens]XP_048245518.1 uncharacterized protein LOC124144778 [Haliotis rufescens]
MSDTSSETSGDVGGCKQIDLSHVACSFMFKSISRPTTASSIRAKLWSRERQAYEEEYHRNMQQFRNRPYMKYEYPEIGRHYPGTWRTAGPAELDSIVARLTKKTAASVAREHDIKSQHSYVLKKRGKSTRVKMDK